MSPDPDRTLIHTVGRRTFLKVLGSTAPAAAVAACAPVPADRLIPYVVPPEDVVPGVSTWYATVCGECPAGCGMRVRTREGRAVKVEGNPEHPVNRGSLCIRGQASLQGLYNPDRFAGPKRRRMTNAAAGHSILEAVDWSTAETLFVEQLRAARGRSQTERIAVVTPLLAGTLDELVDRWADALGARRLRYEPFAYEAMREANMRVFGAPMVPRYNLATPDLVISFGADFLETWLSTVEYSRDFASGRRLQDGRRSRFVQIEPRQSLTGAGADERLQIEPGTEGLVAAAMVHTIVSEDRALASEITAPVVDRIRALVGDYTPAGVADQTGLTADAIVSLARRFSDPTVGSGRSVALGGGVASTGETATATMVAINILNYVAGNIGTTVIFDAVDAQVADTTGWAGVHTHRDMVELTEAMRNGEIDLLVLHNVNPVHGMPGGADFAAALSDVPMVVSTSSCPDETSQYADLVLPTHTPLESWGDVAPRSGVRGLMQPTMEPVFDTKHLGDLLLDTGRAVGPDVAEALPADDDFLELLQTRWKTVHAGSSETSAGPTALSDTDFETAWADTLRRGGFWRPAPQETVTLNPAVLDMPLALTPPGGARSLALIVYPSLHLYDGRGANRAWLQEVPDPLMKITWSSWAEIAPETAHALDAVDGQLLRLESDFGAVDATVVVNPHLGPGIVAMPLGQGHTHYGRYATGRGVNPTTLLDPDPDEDAGGPRWLGTRVDAMPRAVQRPVPRLQTTFTQDGRGIAQAVSLETLAARTVDSEPEYLLASLHPEHTHPVHRWGMAIDLDSCTGCNACVAACYAENNVPVLGADAMRAGRTMSWLRIERFDEDGNGDNDNRFVPMLCQQCDHAPCETVCPTYATYHTDEGLNAQVYNRCVGTRYCANNCPYKVRRFNWYNPEVPEPLNLQLNPDVTTRVAGVMEKCTFCVQRIREGQDRAKDDDRSLRDGEITPACAQTCPAQAIVFGDLNDPTSRVSELAMDPRAYRVLEALNTRPAVTYLRKIREG